MRLRQKLTSATDAVKGIFGGGEDKQDDAVEKLEKLKAVVDVFAAQVMAAQEVDEMPDESVLYQPPPHGVHDEELLDKYVSTITRIARGDLEGGEYDDFAKNCRHVAYHPHVHHDSS